MPMLNFIDIGTHLYCVSILDCRFNRHYVITAEELLGSVIVNLPRRVNRVETEEGWSRCRFSRHYSVQLRDGLCTLSIKRPFNWNDF